MSQHPGMTIEECAKSIGDCVRINRTDGKNQHKGRGKITGIQGRYALVQPFGGHKRSEPMDPSDLSLWKSRNDHNHEVQTSRLLDVAAMDAGATALLSRDNKINPWKHKPQSGNGKKKDNTHRPIQMEAMPPVNAPPATPLPIPATVIVEDVVTSPPAQTTPSKQEGKLATMNKKEWLKKHCGIIFDCLDNAVQETYPGQEYEASRKTTERILQTLIGDARFLALNEEVLPKAIPLINEFADGELDAGDGRITLTDLEELLAEKRILKQSTPVDPIAEICKGNVDKKEVLRALIGPNGFQSTSELATFVLRELRGMKVE